MTDTEFKRREDELQSQRLLHQSKIEERINEQKFLEDSIRGLQEAQNTLDCQLRELQNKKLTNEKFVEEKRDELRQVSVKILQYAASQFDQK